MIKRKNFTFGQIVHLTDEALKGYIKTPRMKTGRGVVVYQDSPLSVRVVAEGLRSAHSYSVSFWE